MGHASPCSFLQNLSFESGEYSEHCGHRSTGRGGQVQSLSQRNESDTEMLEFVKTGQQIRYRSSPTIQPPDQHHVDLATASGVE